jgi:hypothetical protein
MQWEVKLDRLKMLLVSEQRAAVNEAVRCRVKMLCSPLTWRWVSLRSPGHVRQRLVDGDDEQWSGSLARLRAGGRGQHRVGEDVVVAM